MVWYGMVWYGYLYTASTACTVTVHDRKSRGVNDKGYVNLHFLL